MNFFCVLLCLLWFNIFKNNFVVYQPNGNKLVDWLHSQLVHTILSLSVINPTGRTTK
jgi:hypothetical protein